MIARVLARVTKREVLLFGHERAENPGLIELDQAQPHTRVLCLMCREEPDGAGVTAAVSPHPPLCSPDQRADARPLCCVARPW